MMNKRLFFDRYIESLIENLNNTVFEADSLNLGFAEGIVMVTNKILEIRSRLSSVYFIGNGGSAAIASHMTADYLKNGKMRTCSLYDNSVLTCMGNDYGYEDVFSRQLKALTKKGDLLVAISSSGESANIYNAVKTARELGLRTMSLTGFSSDNKVRAMTDISIWVPCSEYGIVESIHTIILQEIVDIIMERDRDNATDHIS